jgi:hypothetical protein
LGVNLNKSQWFGLFIIFVMVGSIIGFTTYFTGNNQAEEDFDLSLPDSTVIKMRADNIEAKVVEVLPKIFFSAFTNEADITAIDKKIGEVNGIYKIQSKYRQASNPTFNTSLIYTAEISFEKDRNVLEVISDIRDLTESILFEPFSFEAALISVPRNVHFSNDQGFDLNYDFADPLMLAYVVPGVAKGDKLLVRIDASFTGKTLVNSSSYEILPVPFFSDFNASIKEKLPRIVFGSFVDYSDYIDENSLKEKILSLPSVVDANVFSPKPENYFIVSFSAENSMEEDFNRFLHNSTEFTSLEVSEVGEGFSAQLYFNEDENITSLEEKVVSFLRDKNASNVSVTEARTQVSGYLELLSSDASKTISELTVLLSSLDFKAITFQQQVLVSLPSFFDSYGREFIPGDETSTEVFVSAFRNIGDEVELRAYIVPNETVRKGILSINAAEE